MTRLQKFLPRATPGRNFFLFNLGYFFVVFLLILILGNPPKSDSACLGVVYCIKGCARLHHGGSACGEGSEQCAADDNWTNFPYYPNPENQWDDHSSVWAIRVYLL